MVLNNVKKSVYAVPNSRGCRQNLGRLEEKGWGAGRGWVEKLAKVIVLKGHGYIPLYISTACASIKLLHNNLSIKEREAYCKYGRLREGLLERGP